MRIAIERNWLHICLLNINFSNDLFLYLVEICVTDLQIAS